MPSAGRLRLGFTGAALTAALFVAPLSAAPDAPRLAGELDAKWGGELPFTVLYARDGKKSKVLSGKQSYADFEAAVKALAK